MKINTVHGGLVHTQVFVVNDAGVGVKLPLPEEVVRKYGVLLRLGPPPEGAAYPKVAEWTNPLEER